MWEVITSQGHRARDIQHESDALRAVHSLGLTTLIAPFRRGGTSPTDSGAGPPHPAVLRLKV